MPSSIPENDHSGAITAIVRILTPAWLLSEAGKVDARFLEVTQELAATRPTPERVYDELVKLVGISTSLELLRLLGDRAAKEWAVSARGGGVCVCIWRAGGGE